MKEKLPDLKALTALLGINPAYLAIIAVVLAAALVAYKKYLKPWLAKRKAAAAAGPAKNAVVIPSVPINLLSDVWKKFKDELPAIFRRSIFNFQSFVVLGPAGSGKSRLIETYTDWRRQSRQFLSSKVDDPNLQIYLSSRALVFELSPTILQDGSSGARKALEKLFRPLVQRRKPIVVVPVDIVAMKTASPDDVRSLAEVIRGRIGLLSWLDKKPIELRIALTHLDQIEGYDELAKLIVREHLTLTVELDAEVPGYMVEAQLLERFAQFDRLMPLALKTLSSAEYVKVVHFFRDLPKYLPTLTAFISTLTAPDPLSKKPRLEDIYLTTLDGGGSNPFHAPLPQSSRDPLLKHRLAAIAAAAAVIAYGTYGYVQEDELWEPAAGALEEIEHHAITAPSEHDERLDADRETVMNFLRRRQGMTMRRLFPSFFASADHEVRARFAHAVRTRIILPGMEHSFDSRWPYRKSLYFLALLYATKENELGRLIAHDDYAEWSRVTELDPVLIGDYLYAANEPYYDAPEIDGRPLLDELPRDVPSTPSEDEEPWREFFQTLTGYLEAKVILPVDLLELQKRAEKLLEGHETMTRFESLDPILTALEQATKGLFDFKTRYRRAYEEIEAQNRLRQTLPEADDLLRMIVGSELDPIDRNIVLVADLNRRMNLLFQPRKAETRRSYQIELRGIRFEIDPQVWDEVLKNCSAREQLTAFIENTPEPGEALFFRDIDRFDAVQLNRRTDGTAIFRGRATIPGRYTRQAIDRNVRVQLSELSELLARLKDVSPTKSSSVALGHVFLFKAETLEGIIRSGVEIYAANYVRAIDHYYSAFDVYAPSEDAAIVMLKQMQRPVSPFGDFLRAVHDNTKLDLDEKNALFEPLRVALTKYEPIAKLMFEEGGTRPELDAYLLILETMLAALEDRAPNEAPNGKEEKAGAEEKKEEKKPEKKKEAEEEEIGLTSKLDGAGKLSLARLNGDSGTPRTLIAQHLSSLGLDTELHPPFTAPADQIYRIGLRQIEGVVEDGWRNNILSELRAINVYFPFSPDADDDVSPEQLTRLFHPITGIVHDRWRRYVQPVLGPSTEAQKTFTENRAVSLPRGMLETMTRVERLTASLWDAEGNPRPLEVKISAVPFPASEDMKNYLTLVYLTNGANALVNFNQQPMTKTLFVDWTKQTEAKLSIELTNVKNNARSYPSRIEHKGSSWSLLHLLKKAPQTGTIRSWTFMSGEEGRTVRIVVQFSIENDPFGIFDLGIGRGGSEEEASSGLRP